MKRITIICAVLLMNLVAFSQNKAGKLDDAGRIAINAFVPQMGEIGPDAAKTLQGRLDRIVTKSGIGGSSLNQRFILTSNIVELSADVSPTSPPVYSYELEFNFIIGDILEGTKFATMAIVRKGNGRSAERAYLKAIKSLKPKDKKYAAFIEEGKTKIIKYYNANCDIILKKAKTLGDQKKYDESIATLISIPDVCKDCYDKAMDQSTQVYKAKMENECQENISNSKAAISVDDYDKAASFIGGYTPDLQCYPQVESMLTEIKDHRCAISLGKANGAWANKNSSKASKYLSEIPTDSKCASEALKISNEIASNLDEKDKREWALKLKNQKDNVSLQKAKINSAKAIGVAYGRNQPKTITKYVGTIAGWYGLKY